MQTILESIRFNNDGRFPRNELQQLIDNKEEAIPVLLAIIEEMIGDPNACLNEPSRIDHIYALYLLAQFREERLYPLLFPLLSFPSTVLNELIGDVITEGAGRILASVYTGDLAPIQQLIENVEHDEFIRGQGLHAMAILVLKGRLDREGVIQYFQDLLRTCSDEYPTFNAHIVLSLADMNGREAYDEIRLAYENDKVDNMMIGMEDVEHALGMSQDSDSHRYRVDEQCDFIEDTIEELEVWHCFRQEQRDSGLLFAPTKPAAKVNKIGRNDPCPCGSGLKYKKCCAR